MTVPIRNHDIAELRRLDLAHHLPAQPAVFAPDYAPEEIAEIAARLRQAAGLGKQPTGVVASQPKKAPARRKAKA